MRDVEIISVVSGKGGVGKTMVSVAFANELARTIRTLLFDLDFFNRGLTGLFRSSKDVSRQIELPPPSFLEQRPDEKWCVAEVSDNLFMVFYGDLDKKQSDILEMRDVRSLSEDLLGYIRILAERCACEFVILDCHGGPDNTSFAACMIASRSILVSEPDRITLHGTLNFLRILRQESAAAPIDIRLAFNKVVPAFSSLFLFRFYNDFLKEEFGGRELLAIYPLEVYLTKAFEKIPFLTTVYPQSQLAVKTRLALYDLFAPARRMALPPSVSTMGYAHRTWARYCMGRVPRLLNLDFIFKVIAIYSLIVFGMQALLEKSNSAVAEAGRTFLPNLEMWGLFGISAAMVWIATAVFINWSKELDIFLTYSLRTRDFVLGIVGCLILGAFWFVPAALLGALIPSILEDHSSDRNFELICLAIITSLIVLMLLLYARRGFRNIKFDGRYLEGGFRIAFSLGACLLIAGFAINGPHF